MSFKLITLDELKQAGKAGQQGWDSNLEFLADEIIIPAVGQIFARYCNRDDFDAKARTEYVSPREPTRFLSLKSPPVATSPIVELWQSLSIPRQYTDSEKLVNGEDYFVHEAEGMIEAESCFSGGPKSIKVTYTGGYLTADAQGAPTDLRMAALAQAKILFDRREEYGVTGRSIDGSSITLLNVLTLPRQITMMLDPYRVIYG